MQQASTRRRVWERDEAADERIAREEIELLAEAMIAAREATAPLSTAALDTLLGLRDG